MLEGWSVEVLKGCSVGGLQGWRVEGLRVKVVKT